ncbi:hypothetical protein ABZS96_45455 [Streptomyces avermitilis]|uniref:hypothetical protein n=1 Tax=Streptomyces avermitilis TaxID=33903 RepID=UPI0033B7F3A4
MRGATELVAELAGTRPVAVASNAPTDVVEANLRRFFDLSGVVIVGGDAAAGYLPGRLRGSRLRSGGYVGT